MAPEISRLSEDTVEACRSMHSALNATVADQFFNTGARKRVPKLLNFKLICQAGEVSLEEFERAVKILVITESMSGCLGAIQRRPAHAKPDFN